MSFWQNFSLNLMLQLPIDVFRQQIPIPRMIKSNFDIKLFILIHSLLQLNGKWWNIFLHNFNEEIFQKENSWQVAKLVLVYSLFYFVCLSVSILSEFLFLFLLFHNFFHPSVFLCKYAFNSLRENSLFSFNSF